MSTRRKLILFVSIGFIVVLLAALLGQLPVRWRGLLLFSGGWLMAVGMVYQVKLYARQKDTQYYVFVGIAGIIWLSMTVAVLCWFVR